MGGGQSGRRVCFMQQQVLEERTFSSWSPPATLPWANLTGHSLVYLAQNTSCKVRYGGETTAGWSSTWLVGIMSFPYHLTPALVSYFGFQKEKICEEREPPAPLTKWDLLHAGGDKNASSPPPLRREWAATEPHGQWAHKGTQKWRKGLSKTPDNPEPHYSWLLKLTSSPHVMSLTVTVCAYRPQDRFGCPSCSPRRQESE